MTPNDLHELFRAALGGDETALEALAALMPSLDAVDRQWLHELAVSHATAMGLDLGCGHGGC